MPVFVPQDEGSFMIVKDRLVLAPLVHMKTAAVVCLTESTRPIRVNCRSVGSCSGVVQQQPGSYWWKWVAAHGSKTQAKPHQQCQGLGRRGSCQEIGVHIGKYKQQLLQLLIQICVYFNTTWLTVDALPACRYAAEVVPHSFYII
jgi:hypothetical protein